jgi:A/G-specific adenine glycosylase
MIETPAFTTPEHVMQLLQTKDQFGDAIRITASFPVKRHILTHQRIHAQFIQVENYQIKLEQKYFFIEVKNIKMLALPKIINKFLNNLFNS